MLPFSHVWIVLVVKLFGKTHSCLEKQTGLMGETSPVNRIMSFPVQLYVCHKRDEVLQDNSIVRLSFFATDLTVCMSVCACLLAILSSVDGRIDAANLFAVGVYTDGDVHTRLVDPKVSR